VENLLEPPALHKKPAADECSEARPVRKRFLGCKPGASGGERRQLGTSGDERLGSGFPIRSRR
jgi:hypothetical protein